MSLSQRARYTTPIAARRATCSRMIRQSGEEPVVIEYLKTPPSRERLKELSRAMGVPVRALLREKGTPLADLELGDPKWSDEQLLDNGASDPDQPADRRDAQRRQALPSVRGRA